MRKKIDVVIDSGRDLGKRFHITEMDSWKWARWMDRAIFAISKNGGSISPEVMDDGLQGLIVFGLQSLTCMDFEQAEPLIKELMECVQIKPDPTRIDFVRPGGLLDGDIEDYKTYWRLRREVLEVHLGFSIADEWLKFQTMRLTGEKILSNTPTSIDGLAVQ